MGSINIFKPLSSYLQPAWSINFSNIEINFLGMPIIEPRAAGWEARMQPLCYAAPQALVSLTGLMWSSRVATSNPGHRSASSWRSSERRDARRRRSASSSTCRRPSSSGSSGKGRPWPARPASATSAPPRSSPSRSVLKRTVPQC